MATFQGGITMSKKEYRKTIARMLEQIKDEQVLEYIFIIISDVLEEINNGDARNGRIQQRRIQEDDN